MGKAVKSHQPCSDCDSSDALAVYEDGSTFCFSCGKARKAQVDPKEEEPHDPDAEVFDDEEEHQPQKAKTKRDSRLIVWHPVEFSKRRLESGACERLGYGLGKLDGKPCQVAEYYDEDGNAIAQKLRFRGKKFRVIGDGQNLGFFGKKAAPKRGAMLIVTEGEVDAVTVSQLFDGKYPVVSVPQGAKSARRTFEREIEWLEGFDSVVICFDQDEPGQAAAEECATILSPRKARITHLPMKDANDMFVAGQIQELSEAILGAEEHRPEGLVFGDAVWKALMREEEVAPVKWPWEGMQERLLGIRGGEIVTITAGTGIGKSAVCKEIAYYLLQEGHKIGYIALEESVKRTALGLLGIHVDEPLWLGKEMPEDELRSAFDEVFGEDRVILYEHFGSLDEESLLARIRYMVRGCRCSFIFLDHLSIVVSGQEEGDERRQLDRIMTRLRSFVEETGVGLFLVSHLRRPEGRGHEDGARTALSQLRGTAGIGQLSDTVIGLERDQQDPEMRSLTTLRILKNRYTGITGEAAALRFSERTGRLREEKDPLEMFSDETVQAGDDESTEEDF